MTTTTHTVKTRYGWGWEVIGPAGATCPIETAIAAQALADALNDGFSAAAAIDIAGLRFQNGRLYAKTR